MHIQGMFSLAGKSAVVIGGTGRFGLPMSQALAEAGARVTLASTNASTGTKVARSLTQSGLDVQWVELDQSDEKSVLSSVKQLNFHAKVDVLVNCGVTRPMTRYMNDTVDHWDDSMNANARGIFLTCRAFGHAMAEQGGGSIINVASIYGLVAPNPNFYEGTSAGVGPDYPFSKGGMIQLSKYFASYLGPKKVRVNCIAPGGLFNDQKEPFLSRYLARVPLGRMAAPEDLKGIAVFLASDASSYVTGTVVPVDGGFTST